MLGNEYRVNLWAQFDDSKILSITSFLFLDSITYHYQTVKAKPPKQLFYGIFSGATRLESPERKT
jgi:hypothetical protein